MARAHLLSALCRAPAQCKVWLEGGSQESRNKEGKLPSLGGVGGAGRGHSGSSFCVAGRCPPDSLFLGTGGAHGEQPTYVRHSGPRVGSVLPHPGGLRVGCPAGLG